MGDAVDLFAWREIFFDGEILPPSQSLGWLAFAFVR